MEFGELLPTSIGQKRVFRKNARVQFPIITPVLTFVFGLIGGKLLEAIIAPLFATEWRALLGGFFLTGLLTASVLVLVGAFARRAEKREQAWHEAVERLRRQIGLSVEFVHDPPPGTGECYRRAKEIVEMAQESILVLSWNIERDPEDRKRREDLWSEVYRKARSEYAQALIRQAEKHPDKPYFYKRIHQFADGKGHFGFRYINLWMIEHSRQLLERERKGKRGTVIKVGKPIFPYTYVIVDNRYAILAIDGYDPETRSQGMDGVLIFDDPGGAFVPYLVSFFEAIEAHGIGYPPETWEWEAV